MKSIILSSLAVFLFPVLSLADISVEIVDNPPPSTRPITWSVRIKLKSEERIFIEPVDLWTRVVKELENDGTEVVSNVVAFSGQVDSKGTLILEPDEEYAMTIIAKSEEFVPGEYQFQIYKLHYTKEVADGKGKFEELDHELDIRSPVFSLKTEKIGISNGPLIIGFLILMLWVILCPTYPKAST